MKGDFSRHTFHPDKHFSAVLMQQGRVLLDADFNEQAAIQLYVTRALAADIIGPHGGPGGGFKITMVDRAEGDDGPANVGIAAGHYYVNGILVDATRPRPLRPVTAPGAKTDDEDAPEPPVEWTYWDQPWAYLDPERESDELPDRPPYLVYLKVWEELVTAVEDPQIRESALGVALPDTAARSRVFWQVLAADSGDGLDLSGVDTVDEARERFAAWAGERTAASWLAARTERPPRTEEDPCIIAPDSRYRGPENQLYRVEVHAGGARGTFKWSRDNGSITFPIVDIDGRWVTLEALGRDDKLDLHVGESVEVVDDAYAARGEPGRLLRVEDVDLPDRRVLLSAEPAADVGRVAARHPLLRRWDRPAPSAERGGAEPSPDGAVRIEESRWLDLEDGVQVYFRAGGTYRTGDYWLIPARTLTGEVEWPQDSRGRPLLRAPHGVPSHYAPLAWARGEGDPEDLRHVFAQLTAGTSRG